VPCASSAGWKSVSAEGSLSSYASGSSPIAYSPDAYIPFGLVAAFGSTAPSAAGGGGGGGGAYWFCGFIGGGPESTGSHAATRGRRRARPDHDSWRRLMAAPHSMLTFAASVHALAHVAPRSSYCCFGGVPP
jgi:hypothetical protein